MKTTRLILSVLALSCMALFANEAMPLKIDAGEKWKVDYKGDGIQFFTITRPGGEHVLLMFSRWPVPGGKEQITPMIKQMADAFLAEAAKQEELKTIRKDYKVEKIEGVQYSGEAAVFETEDGMRQTLFMISNGDGIWNGQFTGSGPMWDEAKELLKKIKKAE